MTRANGKAGAKITGAYASVEEAAIAHARAMKARAARLELLNATSGAPRGRAGLWGQWGGGVAWG